MIQFRSIKLLVFLKRVFIYGALNYGLLAYLLDDMKDDEIPGVSYEYELQKVKTNRMYQIEKI